MGRQIGDIKITGTFGELTFYNHKVYGPLVRGKGGPPPGRVKHGKEFENTRNNGKEFKLISGNCRVLRHGLRKLLKKETRLASRLMSVGCKVRNQDKKPVWGERCLAGGLKSGAGKRLLEGYEFMTAPASLTGLKAQLKDAQVKIAAPNSTENRKSNLCLALTVARLGIDFEKKTSELQCGTTVFFSPAADRLRPTLKVPDCKKEWPFEMVVLQVKKAQKLKNEILIKEDSPVSLRILKIFDGKGK